MNLQEKINAALAEYVKIVNESNRIKSDDGRVFVVALATDAANRLLLLAKTIRENVHLNNWQTHGRVPGDCLNDLLAWGQPLTSYLFQCNLRSQITDLIEHHYGISFSALGIYQQVTDKADGKPVFVAYNPRRFGGTTVHDRYTLIKDGELFSVSLSEFDTNYKA